MGWSLEARLVIWVSPAPLRARISYRKQLPCRENQFAWHAGIRWALRAAVGMWTEHCNLLQAGPGFTWPSCVPPTPHLVPTTLCLPPCLGTEQNSAELASLGEAREVPSHDKGVVAALIPRPPHSLDPLGYSGWFLGVPMG